MEIFHTISDIIFLKFIAFTCKFDSPQVKQNLISSIVIFIYELPPELPNNLRSLRY